MAITQAVCNSFKQELAQAVHNFTITTGHVFKMALYVAAATLDAATTAYSATNEAAGAGYSAGGFAWTAAQNITPQLTGATAFWSWSINPSWVASTITARGALIYNSSAANKAVCVLDFGADKSSTNGTFTVVLPTNDSTNAILRIA